MLVVLLMIFPLSRPAAAEGLVDALADVDDAEYYSTSPIARAPANSYVTLFGESFHLYQGSAVGFNGVEVSDMTFSNFLPPFYRALSNVETAIERAGGDSTVIQSLLTTYLPRIDTNTAGLHGDLLNIQQALGWAGSSSMTIWQLLDSLRTNLLIMQVDVRTIISKVSDIYSQLGFMAGLIHDGFEAVNTRQDSMFNSWFNGAWPSFSYRNGAHGNNIASVSFSSFPLAFQESQRSLIELLSTNWDSYLGPLGDVLTISGSYVRPSISYVLQSGLLGLSRNIVGSDQLGAFTAWRGPDQTVSRSANNVLDMLGLLGAELQGPLAKLQYVWADDDDIRIADKNQPVKDEIEDNFVGDGEAAVKPSDIGDVASFGTGLKDAFSGSGSPSDIFSLFGDSHVSWFFSQEVADDLDQVNSPAPASEESPFQRYLSAVDVDADGFVHPKSSSFWDVSLYQG